MLAGILDNDKELFTSVKGVVKIGGGNGGISKSLVITEEAASNAGITCVGDGTEDAGAVTCNEGMLRETGDGADSVGNGNSDTLRMLIVECSTLLLINILKKMQHKQTSFFGSSCLD